MQKWEYKTTERLNEDAMNKLGEEGWELVAAVDTGYSSYLFFKRPKS
jgi:hypothetical protein